MTRINLRLTAPLVIMFLFALSSRAQEPSAASAAPIPGQIVSAKKLFIANGGEQRNPNGDLYFSGGPDRAYNQFYAVVKNWGRYEIVSAPADADLVFQIRLADVRRDGLDDELDLVILDPKTNVILWSLSEPASAAGRQKTRDAAFDRALSLLSNDLKKLVAGPTVASTGAVKN
jgi:hypothetical protein